MPGRRPDLTFQNFSAEVVQPDPDGFR
jgi:hypothetical protein